MEDTFYRLACRIKSSGAIARSADYHDLQTIQNQVTALNAERGEACEYFVESVKLNALLPWEVLSLAEQNLITLDQLERYSNKSDDYRYVNTIKELIQEKQSRVQFLQPQHNSFSGPTHLPLERRTPASFVSAGTV
jgi:hypothetical protein